MVLLLCHYMIWRTTWSWGKIELCVSWAAAYNSKSWTWNVLLLVARNNSKSINTLRMSISFVYIYILDWKIVLFFKFVFGIEELLRNSAYILATRNSKNVPCSVKTYSNLHVNYMLKPHLKPSQPNTNTHGDKLIMNFI